MVLTSYGVGCCFLWSGLYQSLTDKTVIAYAYFLQMTNEDYLIQEILIKEEEKHQLIFMGAVRNLPEAIRQTLFLYKE